MDAGAALYVALSGAVVTALGVLFTRLSSRDAARATAAAHQLDEIREQHALYRDLVAELRTEVERTRLARESDRTACLRAVAELQAALDRAQQQIERKQP